MGRGKHAIGFTQRIGVERQRTLRGDPRIQLSQGTGGTVARIGQGLLAAFAGTCVVGLETGPRHVDLAAHLKHVWCVATQDQRDRLDRAQVHTDILASRAVATGCAAHEQATLVTQADREPVEFWLHREYRCGVAGFLLDAAHEVRDFLVAEGVGQRQHRHRMRDLFKTPGRCVADAPGR